MSCEGAIWYPWVSVNVMGLKLVAYDVERCVQIVAVTWP
jgi:hypothetical protein